MAHTKAQGSVAGNRDSRPKRLGVKVYGGAKVKSGGIIVRQKGNKFFAGENVSTGKDFTLFSLIAGVVSFRTLHGKKLVEVK
jgi:large subunit ribosomal protein L27